jgi:hypothetical protein
MSAREGRAPLGIRFRPLKIPSTIKAAITIVANISAVTRTANARP